MISVVCCSIDPVRAAAIERHYERLLGDEPYEIVAVRDARSLAEGDGRAPPHRRPSRSRAMKALYLESSLSLVRHCPAR